MPISKDANTNKKSLLTKILTYQNIIAIPNSISILPDLLPLVIDMTKKKYKGEKKKNILKKKIFTFKIFFF